MLNIYFGNMPEAIENANVCFDNTYKAPWITKDITVKIIKDLERSKVIDSKRIKHPYFGVIHPTYLSREVKTLILIASDKKHVYNATQCSDKCAKWIMKMAEKSRVTINLRRLMDFGKGDFKIRVLNTDKVVTNMQELVLEAGEFV